MHASQISFRQFCLELANNLKNGNCSTDNAWKQQQRWRWQQDGVLHRQRTQYFFRYYNVQQTWRGILLQTTPDWTEDESKTSPPTFLCPNAIQLCLVLLYWSFNWQETHSARKKEDMDVFNMQSSHLQKTKIQWTELFSSVPQSRDIVWPVLCWGTKHTSISLLTRKPTYSTFPSYHWLVCWDSRRADGAALCITAQQWWWWLHYRKFQRWWQWQKQSWASYKLS